MSRVYCVKCRKLGLITCVCVETPRVIVWQDWQKESAREATRPCPETPLSGEQDTGAPRTV
jgi:hypothetical protein